MITLNIDADDAQNAYDMMELEFFQHLKNLLDIDELDNRRYVASLLRVMDELEKAAKGASNDAGDHI